MEQHVFYPRAMHLKDADGVVNSVDPHHLCQDLFFPELRIITVIRRVQRKKCQAFPSSEEKDWCILCSIALSNPFSII